MGPSANAATAPVMAPAWKYCASVSGRAPPSESQRLASPNAPKSVARNTICPASGDATPL